MLDEFKDVVKSKRSYSAPSDERDVHYRTCTHFHKKQGPKQKVVVRLGREVMKSLGWKCGDRVKMEQSKSSLHKLRLKRSDEVGYVLVPAVITDNKTYSDQKGSSERAYFNGAIYPETPIPRTEGATIPISDFEISENGGGLLLNIPPNKPIPDLNGMETKTNGED